MSRGGRGTVSLELVITAPVLLAVLSLMAAFGRFGNAEGVVEQAARDAARAATQTQNEDDAYDLAEQIVADALQESPPSCQDSADVRIDTSQPRFEPSNPYGDEPMNMLTVTVRCTVDTSDLAFLPLGSFDIEHSFVSPLDALRGYYAS